MRMLPTWKTSATPLSPTRRPKAVGQGLPGGMGHSICFSGGHSGQSIQSPACTSPRMVICEEGAEDKGVFPCSSYRGDVSVPCISQSDETPKNVASFARFAARGDLVLPDRISRRKSGFKPAAMHTDRGV